MPVASSFTFLSLNGQFLNWTLTDSQTGLPINNATVTATLYSGRSRFDPDGTPGTAVTGFTNISLIFQSNGLYQGQIPATFDPGDGGGFILVVDATAPGYLAQHWEVPANVTQRVA